MLFAIAAYVAGGLTYSVVSAWLEKEVSKVKADIAVELAKVTPDIAKVRNLISKL